MLYDDGHYFGVTFKRGAGPRKKSHNKITTLLHSVIILYIRMLRFLFRVILIINFIFLTRAPSTPLYDIKYILYNIHTKNAAPYLLFELLTIIIVFVWFIYPQWSNRAEYEGNIFRVTGSSWGESVGHLSLPLTMYKCQWHGALVFFFICARTNDWANNRDAVDLRCHRGHYDVIVMIYYIEMA